MREEAARLFEVPGFELRERIGAGGFGEVYRAHHTLMGRDVAIKVLHAKYSKDPDAVARFIAEARAVARISHPAIVEVFEFGELADGRHYCVMELVRGTTLRDVLRDRPQFPLLEALVILRAMAEAIDAAHAAGIAHRDLKPDNVFVLPDGSVKLIDFGLAKLTADSSSPVTQTGSMLGTPLYMSPEQCRGKALDARTDLYSFGVVAYQVLAGRTPFEGEALDLALHHLNDRPVPPSRYAELPSRVDRVVLALLEKEPSARPAPLVAAVDAMAGDVRFRAPGRIRKLMYPLLATVVASGVLVAWRVWPSRDSSASAVPTCAAGDNRLYGVWDPTLRAALRARFRAAHRNEVDVTIDFVERDLDMFASEWSRQWDASCEAADRLSDPLLYAQRQSCLERQLLDLRGVVASTFDQDPVRFSAGWNGTFFAWALPLEECTRTEVLRVLPAAPPTHLRDEVARLVMETHRARADARAQYNAGSKTGGAAAVRRLDIVTRELDRLGVAAAVHAAVLHAWYSFALAKREPEHREQARASAKRAIELARKYHDDRRLALAYQFAAHVEIDAGVAVPPIESLLARADEALARSGSVSSGIAPPFGWPTLDILNGEYERAFERIQLQRATPASRFEHWAPIEANEQVVGLLERDGRHGEAVAAARAGLAVTRTWWRGDHWMVAQAQTLLAGALFWAGHPAEALAEAKDALAMARRIGRPGLHPRAFAIRLYAAHTLGRVDEREVAALAALQHVGKGSWPELAVSSARAGQHDLAAWLLARAQPGPSVERARSMMAWTRGELAGPPAESTEPPITTATRKGLQALAAERWAEVRDELQLGLDLQPGPFPDPILDAGIGRALVELGDLERARFHLERALYVIAVERVHADEWLVPETRFALARAIWVKDPVRARRHAELAHVRFTPFQAAQREATTAWLSRHPVP